MSDIISVRMVYPGRAPEYSVLVTHGPAVCEGTTCCIHHPSVHHMRDWEQMWNGSMRRMERICPDGFCHPDPDDQSDNRWHICDGCCQPGLAALERV